MLVASEILENISSGNIKISSFNVDNLGPNSYNLSISDEVTELSDPILDPKAKPTTYVTKIGAEPYILYPGRVYLVKSQEVVATDGVVAILYGRSSAARLGISVTSDGGLGDNGYSGQWTMAISVQQPVKIYRGMSLSQLVFFKVTESTQKYSGKYLDGTAVSKYNEEIGK
jgi:dCTP deaminase